MRRTWLYVAFGCLALASLAPAALAAPIVQNAHELLATAAGASATATVTWLATAGYLVLFIALFLEGALVSAAASFAAALGYFDIRIVFVLAVLGDVLGDLVYYGIGRWGRVALMQKYGARFGLSPERLQKFEQFLANHPIKSLVFVKLAPISAPGLVVVGASRMPLVRYLTICSLIILPKVVFFMGLGYFFGAAYVSAVQYARMGENLIALAVVVVVAAYWGYRKLSANISRRMDVV